MFGSTIYSRLVGTKRVLLIVLSQLMPGRTPCNSQLSKLRVSFATRVNNFFGFEMYIVLREIAMLERMYSYWQQLSIAQKNVETRIGSLEKPMVQCIGICSRGASRRHTKSYCITCFSTLPMPIIVLFCAISSFCQQLHVLAYKT